jgi:hypothetical protein
MNPQNQKQPCEPGRVARFADRWSKLAIGSNRNLGLGIRLSNGMSLAALVLGTAGSALAADLTVSMMPSHHQNEHYAKAVVGQPIQVWGKASGGDYAGYTIDFGDGSVPATGDSVPKPEFINSLHSYTHSGTFVASLSVTNSDGKVFDRKVNIKVVAAPSEQDKIDIAIEKGLLNLYQAWPNLMGPNTLQETNLDAFTIASMSATLLAFEKNGHLSGNNPVADVYQQLVNQGIESIRIQSSEPSMRTLSSDQSARVFHDYFNTRSLALSTLALIESMPNNPLAPDYNQRWAGPDGNLIRRLLTFISSRIVDQASVGGVGDTLEFLSDDPNKEEAMEWVALLLTKYMTQEPDSVIKSNLASGVVDSWTQLGAMRPPRVVISAGSILGYIASNVGLEAGIIQFESVNLVNYGAVSGLESGIGWAGRIDTMFILANASRYAPDFSSDIARGAYCRDWTLPISRWLLGNPNGLSVDVPRNGTREIAPDDRAPTKLFGQNPDGSWTGPQLPYPNDVVSTPLVTTALAVSTLIREDVAPSDDQIHAEYSANFVGVSGGNNSLPGFASDLSVNNDGTVSVGVFDSDGDWLDVVLDVDGKRGASIVVPGLGVARFNGTGIGKLYGTNTFQASVNDGWGTTYRSRIVERPDIYPPYFPDYFKSFMTDLQINTDPGSATAGYTPPLVRAFDRAADGSEKEVSVLCSPVSMFAKQSFKIGLNTVTYTASDPAGITATISKNITVIDAEPPTVTTPSNINVYVPGDANTCDIELPVPDAKDNSGVVKWEYKSMGRVLCSSDSGVSRTVSLPIGLNMVNLIVKDGSGNMVYKTFYAMVNDYIAPVLTKPNDITVNNRPRNNGGDVYLPTPVVTDNSGSVSWAYTWGTNSYTSAGVGSPGNFFPIGTNQVSLTAFDPSGNTSSCTIKVTVVDNEAPVIGGTVASFSKVTDPGYWYATVTPSIPSATDNSGTVTRRLSCNNVTYFFVGGTPTLRLPIGINVVNYTVVDPSGNMATTSFSVTVQDTEAPKFGMMPLVSVPAFGASSVSLANSDVISKLLAAGAVIRDNDGESPTLTINRVSPSTFNRGRTPVTLTARDSSGNAASIVFAVQVY